MFDGKAEEAMNFYSTVFDDSQIISISRYGENEDGIEGKVKYATFSLHGQEFMCIDSHVKHDFTFTPSISLHVTCDSDEEIERLFTTLAQDGAVLMQLETYPFSKKYGWVADKFGVSWQLQLAES